MAPHISRLLLEGSRERWDRKAGAANEFLLGWAVVGWVEQFDEVS